MAMTAAMRNVLSPAGLIDVGDREVAPVPLLGGLHQ